MLFSVKLKLLALDEEYVFSMPSAYARSILTVPWAEMGDKINMTCQKTNLSSTVTFHTKVFNDVYLKEYLLSVKTKVNESYLLVLIALSHAFFFDHFVCHIYRFFNCFM